MSSIPGFELYPKTQAAEVEALRRIVQAWMSVTVGAHPRGLELIGVVKQAADALIANQSLHDEQPWDERRAELAKASADRFFTEVEGLVSAAKAGIRSAAN